MKETDVNKIFLFFYLSLLNVDKAFEATEKVIKKVTRFYWLNFKRVYATNSEIVAASNQILQSYQNAVTSYTIVSDLRVKVPNSINLGLWRDFIRSSPSMESTALIWVHILDYKIEEVTQGLRVSEGTLRFRLSHALQKFVELK